MGKLKLHNRIGRIARLILTNQPRVVHTTPGMVPDNCDVNHPAKFLIEIDPSKELLDIQLSVYTEAFRSYATSAASGGGATSGSGGGQTSSSTDISHQHLISAIDTATSDTNGHHHQYWQPSGTSSSGGGSHSHTVDNHQHTVPAHTHPIVFGIFEQTYNGSPVYAACRCYINQIECITPVSVFGTEGSADEQITMTRLSIKSLYNPNGSGGPGELAPGVNWVFIKPIADEIKNPDGLVRLYLNVDVKYMS